MWRAIGPDGAEVAVQCVVRATAPERAAQARRIALLRELRHPHVLRLLDVLEPRGRTVVVTEVVEGPTLAALRPARGPLAPGEVLHVVAALGDALAHLHERGVVHGDVSPSNVVFVPGRGPVLVDVAGNPGAVRGTPGFAAPERLAGAPPSPAADLWSLVATARWAAAGAAQAELDGVLGSAAADDPAARGTAAELADRARAQEGTAPVELPGAAALAAGSLRAAGARLPVTVVERRRLARRPPSRRRRARPRRWWRDGLAVLLGVTLALGAGSTLLDRSGAGRSAVAAVGSASVPVESPERQTPDDPASGSGSVPGRTRSGPADATHVARTVVDLVLARDRALESGDGAALAALSRPGSAVAADDAALVRALAASRVELVGLRTVVESVEVLGSGAGGVEVEAVLRQDAHTRVEAGTARRVPSQEPRCVLMSMEEGPAGWRLAGVGVCARQATNQVAASSMSG